MKRDRISRAMIVVFVVLLFVLLVIFLKDLFIQIDTNERIERLRIIEYVESQEAGKTEPQAMAAYLSSLDHRNVSHGLFVAIIGSIFTFLAFYVQYLFNAAQKEDISRERFENGYAHLLDVFRGIGKDLDVPRAGSGKVAFHYMFYEYKAIFYQFFARKVMAGADIEKMNKVVFSIFLNGISAKLGSEITICELTDEERDAINAFCLSMLAAQKDSEREKDAGVFYLSDYKGRSIKYFDGHRQRLVPYFKYLVSILDYIRENENKYSNQDAIQRQLFSEMSDHEIGLIYSYFKFHGIKDYDGFVSQMANSVDQDCRFKFLFDYPGFIKGMTPIPPRP